MSGPWPDTWGGISLRVSWRVNGFWGEVYRLGASWPIQYTDLVSDKTVECPLSEKQVRSALLREKILSDLERRELESMGCRMKFPAKSGSLATRWCSSILKIMVADTAIRNLEPLFLERFAEVEEDERILGFTLDSKCHQVEAVGKMIDTSAAQHKEDMTALVSQAVSATAEKAEEVQNIIGAWSDEPGKLEKSEVNTGLLDLVSKSQVLKDISRYLGRFREIFAQGKRNG